jgi:hypothetical protein
VIDLRPAPAFALLNGDPAVRGAAEYDSFAPGAADGLALAPVHAKRLSVGLALRISNRPSARSRMVHFRGGAMAAYFRRSAAASQAARLAPCLATMSSVLSWAVIRSLF